MLIRLIAVFFALSAACAAAPASAQVVFPPGSRIGLTPPADMVVSKRFAGFEDLDRKAIITILDLPLRAYGDLERSAFTQVQNGLTDVKREIFPFNNGIGFLISGRGKEGAVSVHKWFLVGTAFGGRVPDLAAVVSAIAPDSASAIYSDAVMRKALASVTFRPAPIAEQLGLLPFTLGDLAGFQVLQVLPTGSVVLTDGPATNIGNQPYMIVSVGRGAPSNADERDRFARDMLANAPLSNLRIQVADPMRITGATGIEIRAQSQGPNGEPVAVVQWVRFSGDGYLRIIGVTAKAGWDALFPRFRAVRDGIAFR
jgi:hypothetical protein